MMEKGKQLTFSKRNKIEEMLNQRKRKFEIANELDKTQSTIAREINMHRILKPHNIYNTDNLYNCKVCIGKCKIFQTISCKNRDRNIGACNNWSSKKLNEKIIYFCKNIEKDIKSSQANFNRCI